MSHCKQDFSLTTCASVLSLRVFFGTILVLSCDGLAFSKWNQSVRGDPPQHWSQEQTECGDAENQQVHLEGKAHLSALIALKGSLL